MIFVSVTRLRIRALRFIPGFAFHTLQTRTQVQRAAGFLGGSLLPDRDRAFWTMTLWRDEAHMRRYMVAGAHLKAMPKLMDWCDEASVVHWSQEGERLPDWREADRRMRAEGRPSKLRHPSAGHPRLDYREPRTERAVPLRPAAR